MPQRIVSFQPSHIRKVKAAGLAAEPIVLPGMYARVLQHIVLAVEASVAKAARKWLCDQVRGQMPLQVI